MGLGADLDGRPGPLCLGDGCWAEVSLRLGVVLGRGVGEGDAAWDCSPGRGLSSGEPRDLVLPRGAPPPGTLTGVEGKLPVLPLARARAGAGEKTGEVGTRTAGRRGRAPAVAGGGGPGARGVEAGDGVRLLGWVGLTTNGRGVAGGEGSAAEEELAGAAGSLGTAVVRRGVDGEDEGREDSRKGEPSLLMTGPLYGDNGPALQVCFWVPPAGVFLVSLAQRGH